MQFSMTLIALVAGLATALPAADSSSWGNVANKQPNKITTTSAWGQYAPKPTPVAPAKKPSPTPNGKGPATPSGKGPADKDSTKQDWESVQSSSKQPAVKVATTSGWTEKASVAKPAAKPAFSAPASDLKNKLGNPPSDNCPWDFVLSCAQQASNHGDSCLKVLAKGTDNCFSDNTCASAIGTDAPTCATCYTALGKQKFITAVHNEKSDANVGPVFTAMVSAGVCDNSGKALKA